MAKKNKNKAVKSVELESPIGRSGTSIYGGYIRADSNPDFYTGSKKMDLYHEMLCTDSMVNSTVTAMKLPILSAEMMVKPGSDDPAHEEHAQFIDECLRGMDRSFEEWLEEALNYLPYGFYLFEKVFTIKNGRVVWKDWEPRIPTSILNWKIADEEGGVTQQLLDDKPGTQVEIPFSKLIHLVHKQEGDDYEGRSVLRTIYKNYYYKDTFYRIQAIKAERMAGIPVITLPKGSSTQDKSDAEELGKNLKINEKAFVVKPSPDWGLEFMTTGIADQSSAIMDLIRHHNDMIAQNILAQFLLLGSGDNSGSYALSEDQSSFFTLGLRAIAKNLAQTLNKQAVKELIDLNFGPQEVYPSIDFTKIGDVDYGELSNALSTLANANLISFSAKEKLWLHKTMGLPELTLEEMEERESEKKVVDEMKSKIEEMKQSKQVEQTAPTKEEDAQAEGLEDQEYAERKFAEKRDMTLAEMRVNFAEIGGHYDKMNSEVDAYLNEVTDKQLEDTLAYMENAIETGNVAAIKAYTVPQSQEMKGKIQSLANESLSFGEQKAAEELDVKLPQSSPEQTAAFNALVSEKVDSRNAVIEKKVKDTALNVLLAGIGVAAGVSVISSIFKSSAAQGNMSLNSYVSGAALNLGRYNVFDEHHAELHGLQRSEVLDQVTCPMCLSLDGRVVDSRDNFGRLGDVHTNCRGLWVGVLKTDSELPKVTTIPKSIINKFDTIEGVPVMDSFVQPSTPIYTKKGRVGQAVQDGALEDNPSIK